MHHLDIPQFIGLLVLLIGLAKILGSLARRLGQPAVLGELLAGVLVSSSVLGLLNLQERHDPRNEPLHLLAEIGVIILLFEIGLETDLRKLLRVGGASAAVALAGVVLPFALGYGVCSLLGVGNMAAIVAGAALTATSVGITARVLSDLGRLQQTESQIVLGAAVIDDVIGLIILAVVAGVTQGENISFVGVAKIAGTAFGFLAGTLLLGKFVVPPLFKWFAQIDLPGTATIQAVLLAFGLSWLATYVGSATIIGAFAAGLLLNNTPFAHEIERGVTQLGHFFVPLFFVSVGAAVDVRVFDPTVAANWPTLQIGALLTVAAVVGKFAAGYAAFWLKAKKSVIGVGMIPRGEVGLIFAQMGLASGAFDSAMFSAVTLMVMVTTFLAPPLLRILVPPLHPGEKPPRPEGIEDLVTEA